MSRGLHTDLYTPIVTTTLKQMIVSFQFCGHGADELGSGCQPFLVAYAGNAHHRLALAAAEVGNQLAQGEQTASLADYRSIRDQEKIKFPSNVYEANITLYRFAVLCQVLLQGTGPKHPFVEAMWATARGLQNNAQYITDQYLAIARAPGADTYFARILRAIQLSVHEYLQEIAVNVVKGLEGIDTPSFSTMIQDLKRGTFQHSTKWVAIPEAY